MVRPRHQRCAAVTGKRIGVRDDQRVRTSWSPKRCCERKASIQISARRVAIDDGPSAHAGAYQRRGGSDLCRAAARLMLKKWVIRRWPARPKWLALARYAYAVSRLIKEKSAGGQALLKALLRAHLYILDNQPETIQTLDQMATPAALTSPSILTTASSQTLSKDGTMTDAEIEAIIARVGVKTRQSRMKSETLPSRAAAADKSWRRENKKDADKGKRIKFTGTRFFLLYPVAVIRF